MNDRGTDMMSEQLLRALLDSDIGRDDALLAFRRLSAEEQSDLLARLRARPGTADSAETATGRMEALRRLVLADLEALCEELD